ncbi:MAG: putative HTH-type transcriptional regulator [Candidatus Omnitrophica bacterium ADurb.Bin277]|nr:MAG: putative HTH-type transcriptional regulator [Candidatus Omnitrophica bacterium ADurb.Bin277]
MSKLPIDPKTLEYASKILKALAHPDRLQIIEELRRRECSVGELTEKLGLAQAIVSKHLSLLKKNGVLASRTDCNFRYYSLANTKVPDVLNCIKKSCQKEH